MSLLLLLLACATPTDPGPAPAPARPDIVLIVLDTLSADHLRQYGYALHTSLGIQPFTAQATRFDNALAPSSWTVPSTATLLTGQHPLRHRLRTSGDVLPATALTLAERLAAAGWTTAGFSHNIHISPRRGFDQGFAGFVVPEGKVLAYPHAARMITQVQAVLDAHPAEPLFLYLQPMNCHGPYRVPEARRSDLLGRPPRSEFRYYDDLMRSVLAGGAETPSEAYRTSLQETYDTAVRYTLDEVGGLLDHLRAVGRYDNALIILTADHGEELLEHGGFSHGYSLHREVLHVPLFIKLPGQTVPTVVSPAVTLADVVPTVLEAVGVPTEGVLDGISLVPAMRGEPLAPRNLIADVGWKRRCVALALQTAGWKLITIAQDYRGRADEDLLYDVVADVHERHNLAAERPELVVELKATLSEEVARLASGSAEPAQDTTDMTTAQLEALGYAE